MTEGDSEPTRPASMVEDKRDTRVPGGFVTKLAFAFILVLVLLGGTAILSVGQITRSTEQRETTIRQYFEDVVLAERLRSAGDSGAAASRGYLLTRNPDFLARLDDAELAFHQVLADLRGRVRTSAGGDLLDSMRSAAAEYEQVQHRRRRDALC